MNKQQQADFRTAIVSLEDATWRALSTDGAQFLQFVSADCIMQLPLGMKLTTTSDPSLKDVMTSEAFVPWKTYKMSDIAITQVGEAAAIISYTADATRPPMEEDDDDVAFKTLISSTWRFDPGSGKWLLCFHQQSPYTPM